MKDKNKIYTKTDVDGIWIAIHDGESWIVECKPQNGYYSNCPQVIDELGPGWRPTMSEKKIQTAIQLLSKVSERDTLEFMDEDWE
jgi:hypothetical protein